MIAFLRGRVLEKHPNRVIVDVAGVGYDVAVPLSTFYAAGEPGAEITLRVHTHVREDQLALFGFTTPLELTVFERLIAVSGIGPKLALAVLSGIEPRELDRGDSAQRSRPPHAHPRRRQEDRRAHRHRTARPAAEGGRSRRRRRRPGRAGDALRDDLGVGARRTSDTIGRRSTRCSTRSTTASDSKMRCARP